MVTIRFMAKRSRRRLGIADWELAALDAIVEGGLGAVAVEPLARRLGVTKGSFYWHFADVGALLEATLARWERVFTDLQIEKLAATDDPRARLRPLFENAASDVRAQTLFTVISAASDHPLVRPLLRRVTRKRIAFLEQAFLDMDVEPALARQQALHLYSAYVGLLHIGRKDIGVFTSAAERGAFVEGVFESLG